jgi:hypothetical protein
MNTQDVGDFCYWVSQGKDKARLTRSANEREIKTWATPVVVSTNSPLTSKLASLNNSTDAQAARLLELEVLPCEAMQKSSDIGGLMYGILDSNYGHAGYEFIRRLMHFSNEEIVQMIEKNKDDVQKIFDVKFKGEERYWQTAVSLAHLALKLGNEWGLIPFNARDCTQWVLNSLTGIREQATAYKVTPVDVLTRFVNEHVKHQIVMRKTGTEKSILDLTNMPRDEVFMRIELFRKKVSDKFGMGYLFVDRSNFRKWAANQGVDINSFLSYMEKKGAYIKTGGKDERISLTRGSSMQTMQTYVLKFNLTAEGFEGLLDVVDDTEKAAKIVNMVSG